MASLLSRDEKHFILTGIKNDVRADGRSRLTYRPMELTTDILGKTNGSARLRLSNTDVLVGVKAEVSATDQENYDEGRIEFSIDCSTAAIPMFEEQGGEDLAARITRSLTQAYSFIPRDTLCIVPGLHCWVLYVDVLILEFGGSLCDIIAIAVKAALSTARIPKVTPLQLDGDDYDIECSDNPNDCLKLDMSNAPLTVTLCKVADFLVVDPTADEEHCSIGGLVISVTGNGQICSVSTEGGNSFREDTISEALDTATKIGGRLQKVVESALLEEEQLRAKKEPIRILY